MADSANPLGVATVEDVVGDEAFVRFATQFDLERLIRLVERDMKLLEASDRWIPGGDDPTVLLPGDVPMVRGIIASAHLSELTARLRGHVPAPAPGYADNTAMTVALSSIVTAIDQAVPFHLDGPTAIGVLTSTPPDAEVIDTMRLPFESVMVVFGREMEVPPETTWPDWFHHEYLADKDLPWTGFRSSMEQALTKRGGSITGLVLISGEDGAGVGDFVLWLVSANPDRDHPVEEMRNDRQRGAVLAYRHNAEWRHIIDNTAAAVAWLDWERPDPLDLPEPNTKEWRKAIRKSQFRKREPWGAAAGVRVVSRRQRTVAVGGPEAAKGTSPRTHIRSGHWRSVRVAARDDDGNIVGDTSGEANVDWNYEGRFIPPTVVNPDGTTDDRAVVYRIPDPAN